MKGICYLCGMKTTLSSEHIIPQCLGGVLKASLYCPSCNSECGHDVDSELARQFGRYATLLQIARERGENQPFTIVSDENGLKFRCDGKMITRADPVVRIDQDDSGKIKAVEVLARNEEELRSIFQSIAKKYNIDPALMIFEQVETPPPVGSHDFVLDNPLIHRSIGKIAYGFACSRLPQNIVLSKAFEAIRHFILGENEESLTSSNFAHGSFMVDNRRPLHKVHLCLNRRERLLGGYVVLFGTFRYTVLLSETLDSGVEWPAIDYTYNPVTQREVVGNLNFIAPDLTREEFVAPKQTKEQVLRALQRGQDVIVAHSPMLGGVSVEAIGKNGT